MRWYSSTVNLRTEVFFIAHILFLNLLFRDQALFPETLNPLFSGHGTICQPDCIVRAEVKIVRDMTMP
jgi:hypothetical protein